MVSATQTLKIVGGVVYLGVMMIAALWTFLVDAQPKRLIEIFQLNNLLPACGCALFTVWICGGLFLLLKKGISGAPALVGSVLIGVPLSLLSLPNLIPWLMEIIPWLLLKLLF